MAGGGENRRQQTRRPVSARWHARRDLQLERALEQLRPDYRTVIVLRYREGRSFQEIAGRLDRSVDAVRKLWLRGITRLKKLLEEHDR